jgi:3-oxoacyl-[acyl-carrier-protein] synthase II
MRPDMRRVVVTGMGLVTPLGIGHEQVWRRLVAGESGVRAIQAFDVSDLPARIAAQVPRGDAASGLFNADDWVSPKDQRRMDDFIVFAMAAAARRSKMPAGSPTTRRIASAPAS